MKIAVLSDGHLFQTFVETYDSVKDFERVIEDLKARVAPDMLFLAGDMFDYKKTETMYVRHYEGEASMMRIREALEKFGKPVYAIRGNHDKEEILAGLDQTVENFHFVGNSLRSFPELSVCFMNSFYETGGYGQQTLLNMERFLKQAVSKMKGSTSILLCHETFAPYDSAIPLGMVGSLKKNFDLVLNGHMHLWNRRAYDSDRIICLPSLLPSRIVKGKYSMEKYQWRSRDAKPGFEDLGTPFGYVVVDSQSQRVELHEFTPSKRILEIDLDANELSLEEARRRLKTILEWIDQREDKESLIVLPEITGSISFSPLYLDDVKNDFPNLHVEGLRYDRAVLSTSFQAKVVSAPTLTVEQLHDKIARDIPSLVAMLSKKGIGIDSDSLRRIIDSFFSEELIERSLTLPQIRLKLQTVLSPVIDVLVETRKQQKPSTFEQNLESLLRMVR
jgi:DNA repair exonuclease SbcCD nuclease subunit